jgi:hypothetical protein
MRRVLAAVFLVALAITILPVWWIHPFHRQTPNIVQLSYTLRSISPWITLICAVISIVALSKIWTDSRWYGKVLSLLAIALIGLCTWFTRQNHFEWMFHPLPNASFARAGDASYVKPTDMVLAINIHGEAVAYPIRLMGYHHIVHDTVGGEPIVATY